MKLYLVSEKHPSRWFEILSYNKHTHVGTIRGSIAEFEENLSKENLQKLGYKVVKGEPHDVSKKKSPTGFWLVAKEDERIRMPVIRVHREEGKIRSVVAQGAFMELEYSPVSIKSMGYRVVKETEDAEQS